METINQIVKPLPWYLKLLPTVMFNRAYFPADIIGYEY